MNHSKIAMVSPDESYYELTANETELMRGVWRKPARILAVQASPRGGRGATEIMLNALLEGMKTAGPTIDIVQLSELEAKTCKGCFKCWKGPDSRCPLEDDLAKFIPKIPSYELMVWATPVYVESVPAILKNLIDRMMILNHPRAFFRDGMYLHPSRHKRMPSLALLVVSGFPGSINFQIVADYVAAVGIHMHMPLTSKVFRPETLSFISPMAAESLGRLKENLKRAGLQIYLNGKVSQDLTDKIAEAILTEQEYLQLADGWWR